MAISIDGKISFKTNIPARFNSINDLKHLETQVSEMDAIIFGANTLRAYGTSIVIRDEKLLEKRQQRQQPPQPLNIVCSSSGNLNPQWAFFSQPLPRELMTTAKGYLQWQNNLDIFHENILQDIKNNNEGKETQDGKREETKSDDSFTCNQRQKVFLKQSNNTYVDSRREKLSTYFNDVSIHLERLDWMLYFSQLKQRGYKKVGILGGATLFSSLLKDKLIDDLWLTLCPLLIVNSSSIHFLNSHIFQDLSSSINLNLEQINVIEQEIFVKYNIKYE